MSKYYLTNTFRSLLNPNVVLFIKKERVYKQFEFNYLNQLNQNTLNSQGTQINEKLPFMKNELK